MVGQPADHKGDDHGAWGRGVGSGLWPWSGAGPAHPDPRQTAEREPAADLLWPATCSLAPRTGRLGEWTLCPGWMV